MSSTFTMNKRQLLILWLCLGLLPFEAALTIRLLPVYAVRLGADPTTTGLFVAFAFLAVALGNITGGWLSDRFGRRKEILLLSYAVWILAALLLTQANTILRLIVLIGVLWFPGGIAISILSIIVALSATAGERGKVFGLLGLGTGVGSLLAGLVGGPIAERWGFPVLFLVMAAVTAVMLLLALFIQDKPTLPEKAQRLRQESTPAAEPPSIGAMLKLLLLTHLLVRLGVFIGGLGSPLIMTQLGFTATAVSSTIAVSAAIALPLPLLLGWLSDRAGRKPFVLAAYGCCVLGVLLLILAQWLWHFWLSASLLAIVDASRGVVQAFVADMAPPAALGRAISISNTTSMAAGILGLSSAGYLMQTIGLNPTLLLGASLPLVAMVLLLYLRKPAAITASLAST
ncbi:MAG: MFS transporter [Caldilineaceae bacterium]|nr:MFS transporter [Caldilineaceae bacterium]